MLQNIRKINLLDRIVTDLTFLESVFKYDKSVVFQASIRNKIKKMRNRKLIKAWDNLDQALNNTTQKENEDPRPKTSSFSARKVGASMPSIRGSSQLLSNDVKDPHLLQAKKNLKLNTSTSILGNSQIYSLNDLPSTKPNTQSTLPGSMNNLLSHNSSSQIMRVLSPGPESRSKLIFTSPSHALMHKRRPIPASTAKALAIFKPKVNLFDPESCIHNISVKDLSLLHEARCVDNNNHHSVNKLKHFLDKFEKHCRNRVLAFNDQCFGPESGKIIAGILEKDDHFTKVNLSKNFISDDGANAFARMIPMNKTIIHLNLSSNSISHVGIAELFEALAENQTLISLDLSSHEGLNRNRIGARGAAPLEWVLQKNKTLQFLSVAGSSVDLEAMESICKGLRNNSSIVGLDVSNNEISPLLGQCLQQCLTSCQLTDLNIANTRLGDQGLVTIAPLFWSNSEKHTGMTRLNLANNGLTTKSVSKLFDSLSKNEALEVLILDKNSLNGKKIVSIINMLRENCHLKHLSMNDCDISHHACDAISDGLIKNRVLEVIHLAKNNFKDAGAKVLAFAFNATTSRIRDIDLSDCGIRDEGAQCMAEAMKNNTSIQCVSLKDNLIYDYAAIHILNAARANKSLKKIELDRNPVSYIYLEDLALITHSNSTSLNKEKKVKYVRKIQSLREFELQKYAIAGEKEVLNQKGNEILQEIEDFNTMYQEEVANEQRKYEDLESELEALMRQVEAMDREQIELDKAIMQTALDNKNQLFDMKQTLSEVNKECYDLESEIKKTRDDMKMCRIHMVSKRNNLQEQIVFASRNTNALEKATEQMGKEIEAMQKALEEKQQLQKEAEAKKQEEESRNGNNKVGVKKHKVKSHGKFVMTSGKHLRASNIKVGK